MLPKAKLNLQVLHERPLFEPSNGVERARARELCLIPVGRQRVVDSAPDVEELKHPVAPRETEAEAPADDSLVLTG